MLIGLSIIVRVVFNVDFPVLKILIGLFFIYLGFKIMFGIPNPVIGQFLIKLECTINTVVDISLYYELGNKLKNIWTGFLSKGIHKFSVDLSVLPAGIYILKTATGNDLYTNRIIKF